MGYLPEKQNFIYKVVLFVSEVLNPATQAMVVSYFDSDNSIYIYYITQCIFKSLDFLREQVWKQIYNPIDICKIKHITTCVSRHLSM